jgi:hypothetical protein
MSELLKFVPIDDIKAVQASIDDIALNFIKSAYEGRGQPEQWCTINIKPIPKSGDLTKPDNYRGISLSSILAKT